VSNSTLSNSTLDREGRAAQVTPTPAAPAVIVRGLVKRYGRRQAVRGVDLDVLPGEIFAFLGPNGAGKTTTVEILEGFQDRTDGYVRVLGVDPATADGAWRDRVGVVLQESEPEPGLSVRECLQLYAGYYQAPRPVDDTMSLVGLEESAYTRCTELSGGQRRRLDVALALIGDPEIVFLDEPTTGFDPTARRAAWEVIAGLRQLGKTIFLTTHYMDEAEYLADRISVLADGRIVAEGTPKTLGGRDRMTATIRFTLPDRISDRDLPAGLERLVESAHGGTLVVRSETPVPHLQMLVDWALGHGFDLPDLEVRRPTLEDVYVALTDRTAKDHQ
jgi:ABC-2 type transport system ATP-binding protein